MPIQNGKYVNPGWTNDTDPAMNAAEMNAISDSIAQLPIANGGTGATTVAGARNNLGLGNTNGAVPVANGGTGGSTAAQARANLGIDAANLGVLPITGGTITGDLIIEGNTEISNFSPDTIVPIANGGTGASNVAAARAALGLGNTADALPIANGGTGATTAADARLNLGITPENLGFVDYIIDAAYTNQGIDSSLLYGSGRILWQKWASGKLEMWGYTTSTKNANVTTTDWNGYVSQYMTIWGTWPVEFAAPPSVWIDVVDFDAASRGDYVLIRGAGYHVDTKKYSPYFKFWRGASKTFGHPQYSFYVAGRWYLP